MKKQNILNLIRFHVEKNENSEGETVTVTKDIRYTVKDGNSVVYMYDLDDVKDHCKRCNYTPIP